MHLNISEITAGLQVCGLVAVTYPETTAPIAAAQNMMLKYVLFLIKRIINAHAGR